MIRGLSKFLYKNRIILAALVSVVLVFGSLDYGIKNAEAKTTQEKIDEAEKKKDELEDAQQESEDELSGLQTEKNSLQGELSELNSNLNDVCATLEDLEDRIMLKEKDISDAEAALEEANQEKDGQYASMVLRVRAMYERKDTSVLNAILSAGSISEMLNVADYYMAIEKYDKQKLQEYKDNCAYIEEEKERLNNEYAELETMKEEAENERTKVSELIEETKTTITKYQSDIEDTEAQIQAYEDAIAEQESDLEYLYKVLEEERAKSLLAAQSTWRNIDQVTFEEGDRTLLANLIYCEAGGESYEGQVAVGAVVINRVLSSVYPDTVTGVIYQKSQFSPAGSGRLAVALAANKATDSCYRAADEAMSGYTNVGNCVYFRTPIPGLTGIQIGGHIFY